jgi:hypothetical protein
MRKTKIAWDKKPVKKIVEKTKSAREARCDLKNRTKKTITRAQEKNFHVKKKVAGKKTQTDFFFLLARLFFSLSRTIFFLTTIEAFLSFF